MTHALNMDSHICYFSCLINIHGRQLILSFCECGVVKHGPHHSNRLCDVKFTDGQHYICKLFNTPHCSVRCLSLTCPPHDSETNVIALCGAVPSKTFAVTTII